MLLLALLAVCASAVTNNHWLDLPAAPFGTPLNAAPTSRKRIDVYVDMACSDSLAQFPVFLQLFDAVKDRYEFVYHLFPLPYHAQAFPLNQAVLAIANVSSSNFFPAVKRVFAVQPQFYNDVVFQLTEEQVWHKLAALVAPTCNSRRPASVRGQAVSLTSSSTT